MQRSFPAVSVLLLLCLVCFTPCAVARDWADIASHEGTTLFLVLGTTLPLATDGSAGGDHALRNADALATTVLVSEGLKRAVGERRPDGSDAKSFPSMHTAAAFAVAAMQAESHPDDAALWYAGAALIGASRVKLRRHYAHDVLAGAILGYGIARLATDQPRGLLLRPFISAPTPSLVQVTLAGDNTPLQIGLSPYLTDQGAGIQAQWRF